MPPWPPIAVPQNALLWHFRFGGPVGGEKSFGATMAAVMRAAATDVRESIVPESGHWIMEENPHATIALVRAFLWEGG